VIPVMTDIRKRQPKPEIPVSLKLKSTVKIPTTNLGYKTTRRWKIVTASKYNSDRQPVVSMWPRKSEIVTSVDSVEIPTPNSGFSTED